MVTVVSNITQSSYGSNHVTQIFEDASSYRGELKKAARVIVESNYDLFVPICISHNSQDAIMFTVKRVESLLEKGVFLRAEERDADVRVFTSFSHCKSINLFITQGKMHNLQHKAVALLCRVFYYETKGLALLYPDVFKDAVPEKAVTLACTAVRQFSSYRHYQ